MLQNLNRDDDLSRNEARKSLEGNADQRPPAATIVPLTRWVEVLRQEFTAQSYEAKVRGNLLGQRLVFQYDRDVRSEPASKLPTGLADGFNKICQRWNLNRIERARLLHLESEMGLFDLIASGQVHPPTGDLKDRMAFVIGISVGLGDLFNDDRDAELQWLNTPKADFGNASAMSHMLEGSMQNLLAVVARVKVARGLV